MTYISWSSVFALYLAAWTSYFGIMSQYDTTFDLEINVGHCIFHGPVILPYILKTTWYMNTILRDYESVWSDVWPKINVGHCDLYFMVQCFCLICWKLFSSWTSYFGTMSPYDPTSDLKIFIGHCDLYFMVQWFCLISWKQFDVWT